MLVSFLSVFPFFSPIKYIHVSALFFYLQEKQALDKKVSNMEDELKVSASRNKSCILTLGLNSIFSLLYKSCVSYLGCSFPPQTLQ